MPKVRYEEMLPSEIVAARTACPIVYVPLGTLEWHGEHDAVGLDALKAQTRLAPLLVVTSNSTSTIPASRSNRLRTALRMSFAPNP